MPMKTGNIKVTSSGVNNHVNHNVKSMSMGSSARTIYKKIKINKYKQRYKLY